MKTEEVRKRDNDTINVRLTPRQRQKLLQLVQDGVIMNVSEGIRSAVHQFLAANAPDPTRQPQPSRY